MNLLPETSEKAALALEWFPTRWQAVLWRNWGVVPIDRLCAVLGADESTLRAAAGDMGLDRNLTPSRCGSRAATLPSSATTGTFARLSRFRCCWA